VNLLYSDTIDQFTYLKDCHSTNDYAISNLSNNDPKLNSCIYTFNQTAGRGQIGRYWYSGQNNNLTVSFRLALNGFQVNDQFLANIAFALAVKDFISSQIKEQVSIKWPNDLYVGDRKIAGILIHNNLRGNDIVSTILGVGINVFENNFPPELPNPISILQLNEKLSLLSPEVKRLKLIAFIHLLAANVMTRFSMLKISRPAYERSYLTALYLLNQAAMFRINDKETKETIRGINEQGKLELEINGQRQLFAFRELEYTIANNGSVGKLHKD